MSRKNFFYSKQQKKSLGHRPVDPCLSHRVPQGHPAGVPTIFLNSMCLSLSWYMLDFIQQILEAQQRYFSYRALYRKALSCFFFLTGNRTIIARHVTKWCIAQTCLCETKCQGRVSHRFGGVLVASLKKKERAIWWENAKVSHKRVFAPWAPEKPKLEIAKMLEKRFKPVFALPGCQLISVNTPFPGYQNGALGKRSFCLGDPPFSSFASISRV